jgi:hypothetical protein
MIVREVSIFGDVGGVSRFRGDGLGRGGGCCAVDVRTEESVARVLGVRVGQAGGTQCPKVAWRPKSSCASCPEAMAPGLFG